MELLIDEFDGYDLTSVSEPSERKADGYTRLRSVDSDAGFSSADGSDTSMAKCQFPYYRTCDVLPTGFRLSRSVVVIGLMLICGVAAVLAFKWQGVKHTQTVRRGVSQKRVSFKILTAEQHRTKTRVEEPTSSVPSFMPKSTQPPLPKLTTSASNAAAPATTSSAAKSAPVPTTQTASPKPEVAAPREPRATAPHAADATRHRGPSPKRRRRHQRLATKATWAKVAEIVVNVLKHPTSKKHWTEAWVALCTSMIRLVSMAVALWVAWTLNQLQQLWCTHVPSDKQRRLEELRATSWCNLRGDQLSGNQLSDDQEFILEAPALALRTRFLHSKPQIWATIFCRVFGGHYLPAGVLAYFLYRIPALHQGFHYLCVLDTIAKIYVGFHIAFYLCALTFAVYSGILRPAYEGDEKRLVIGFIVFGLPTGQLAYGKSIMQHVFAVEEVHVCSVNEDQVQQREPQKEDLSHDHLETVASAWEAAEGYGCVKQAMTLFYLIIAAEKVFVSSLQRYLILTCFRQGPTSKFSWYVVVGMYLEPLVMMAFVCWCWAVRARGVWCIYAGVLAFLGSFSFWLVGASYTAINGDARLRLITPICCALLVFVTVAWTQRKGLVNDGADSVLSFGIAGTAVVVAFTVATIFVPLMAIASLFTWAALGCCTQSDAPPEILYAESGGTWVPTRNGGEPYREPPPPPPPPVPGELPQSPPDERRSQFEQFEIAITRGDGDLVGMDVDRRDRTSVQITKIKDGLISKWNASNPQQQVQAGDWIIDINGITGDAKAMFDAVLSRDVTSIKMVIFHDCKEGDQLRQSPPQPQPCVFEITKGRGVFGMDIDWGDPKNPRIAKIKDGVISTWNASNPQQQVQVGDWIIDINGIRGDSNAMSAAVRSLSTIKMVIVHTRFEIAITRGDGDLIGMDNWGDSKNLLITKINDGLISKWNASNPQQQVQAGDWIIDINGITGDSKAMLDAVRKRGASIEMVIVRA